MVVLKSYTQLIAEGYIEDPKNPLPEKLIGGKWEGMSILCIAKAEGIFENEAQRRRDAGRYKH